MKITDYSQVTSLVDNNVFLLDGDNGTKIIQASDLAKALVDLLSSTNFISGLKMTQLEQVTAFESEDRILIGKSTGGNVAIQGSDAMYAFLDTFISTEQRRMIFRGASLGTSITATQLANIRNGSFKGMFLGDYWTIGGRVWRIVDFDYWINCGDTAFTSHHIVVMPDEVLYNAVMNDTNITTGGYIGSKMYTENLANAKTIVESAFGYSNVKTHREYFVNAVTNGKPSGGAWYDSEVDLPNEIMMYGHLHFSPTSDGSIVPSIYTIDKTQLALMAVCPKFINPARQNQWLRDVVSGAYFADVATDGPTASTGASRSYGVRPVVAVG